MKTLYTMISLDTVKVGDWLFKTSSNPESGVICIVALNPDACYCHTRYFRCEHDAKIWIEYICSSGKKMLDVEE
jgi:hypothetical protein